MKKIEFGDIIKTSFRLFASNIQVVLLFGILGELGMFSQLYLLGQEGYIIEASKDAFSAMFQIIFALPIVLLIMSSYEEKNLPASELSSSFFRLIPVYFLISVIFQLISVIGLVLPFKLIEAFPGSLYAKASVLLVIPCIYFMVTLVITDIIYVKEGIGPMRCFTKSMEMVKGNFWPVFWILLFVFIISIALAFFLSFNAALIGYMDNKAVDVIIQSIVNVFIVPFGSILSVILYKKLK